MLEKFRNFISLVRIPGWLLAGFALVVLLAFIGLFYLRWTNRPRCIQGDCENGRGTLLYRDGSRYEGHFREGQFHREGMYFSVTGLRYEGLWRDGKKDGVGRLDFPGGGVYVGEFRDDKRHGPGTYTWADGTKYAGNWVEDSPGGRGVLILEDGTRFAGEYRRGVIYDGSGMLVYPDGRRYLGQWRRGSRHGQGVLMDPEGEILRMGAWENDKFVSK